MRARLADEDRARLRVGRFRLTDQQRADRALSEDEFRAQVDELAAIYGWESMHVDPLRGKGGIWRTPTHGSLGKGWPDTVYVHPRKGLLFVEFKKELGKTSPDQDRVLAFLRDAGLEVYVWRPSDFTLIQEVLAR
jgi:hypothetical protein